MFDVFNELSALIPTRKCQKYRHDNGFVIVSTYSNQLVYLNSTAGEIFDLCNGINSISEITQILLKEYDIEKDVLKKDMTRIIRDLQWKKIITLRKSKL